MYSLSLQIRSLTTESRMLHGSLGLFAFFPETTALGLTGISPKTSEVHG